MSEHDHVHYDCHLRPFLYISMGSLQQKKMEESTKKYTHTHTQGEKKKSPLLRGAAAAAAAATGM